MKKVAFYPILFAINPILLLLAGNINDIPISELFPSILISPLVATGLMLLINWRLKNIHRSAFFVFLLEFWFFHYGTIRPYFLNLHVGNISLGDHVVFLPIWSIVFILFGSGLVWRRITSPTTITLFLNIFCIALIIVSLGRNLQQLLPQYLTKPQVSASSAGTVKLTANSNMPDIYYMIIDGYGREDVLREIYQYDNSGFIKALQDRGFFVGDKSQCNYMQTTLSLASSLNMDYLNNLLPTSIDGRHLVGIIRQNRVQSLLKSLGYVSVAYSSGFLPTELINADYYYSPNVLLKSQNLAALILYYSPVYILVEKGWLGLPITSFSEQQANISFIIQNLSEGTPITTKPKFVFAHITVPHPPFIYDQNGPITPNDYYILVDGNHVLGGPKAYKQGYIDQLIYINKQILQVIDKILANSANPPIIILQSDHGPGAYLDWQSVDKTCLKERISILNALYLPQGGAAEVPEDITPVNTFAIIFNTYFEGDFKLAENKMYYSTLGHRDRFIDVTNRSEATCDIR